MQRRRGKGRNCSSYGKIQDTFDWISTPGQDMRLMYHNFGIVRKNKELIRHRVL